MNPPRTRLSTYLARCLRILAVALILCFSASFTPAHAEDAPASASVQASESAEGFEWKDYQDPALKRPDENPVAGAIGFVLKFGLVVGMIYGALWLYKKGLIPKGLLPNVPGGASGNARTGMRVVESMALKGTQSLHVVEVGDRVLVVGSNGRETLVKLTEWPQSGGNSAKRSFDAVIERVGEPADVESDFSDELESTLRRIIRPEREEQ